MTLKGDRIAAYARYSSDKQSDTSTDDQLRRLKAYAVSHGRPVNDRLVFRDEAISGASIDRPGFEALMQRIRRKEIDVLLVEDTSRLSRDNADALNLYKELVFHGVQLLSLADGIDSSTKGAKLQYGVKALFADLYLDDLRDKTLRGMEGKALAGLSTGGLPYGYKSTAIVGADGKTITGYKIEILPEQAKILCGIFLSYVAGRSLGAIAKQLNQAGVPSPRARSRHRFKGGWVAETIRSMLYNERYAGVWTFNERRWVKVPGTNKRRPQMKAPNEIIRVERPDLRIVPDDVCQAARARLEAVRNTYTRHDDGTPKGRTAPGKQSTHVLSGLLVCAVCHTRMTLHGARYYRCQSAAKRGTCANNVSVREDVVLGKLLAILHDRIVSPAGIAYARKRIAEKLGASSRERVAELKEHRDRLARTNGRITKVVEAIADGLRSEALDNTLRDLEAQARTEQQTIAMLEAAQREPVRLPAPEEVIACLGDLRTLIARDPIAGREQLRNLFKDRSVSLRPTDGEVVMLEGAILPLVLLATPPRDFSEEELRSNGSGGAILALRNWISLPFAEPMPRARAWTAS